MAVSIYRKAQQADGAFNGGEILEKKPIGFPQDRGMLKPFGNLFYWAHAWTEKGSTIGHHPHKGFEIITFVLRGEIEHYDDKLNRWNRLGEGDVQLMQAGSGIVHAEKMLPGAHMFQVWFDPDLSKTVDMPAMYRDFRSKLFEFSETNGMKVKDIVGGNAPVQILSEGIRVREMLLGDGEHKLTVLPGFAFSAFILQGSVILGEQLLEPEDFFLVTGQEITKLKSNGESRLFVIESPENPSYQTYARQYR